MKDNIQPCEVIESNLLDHTKPTDLKVLFPELRKYVMDGYELVLTGKRTKYKPKY